MAEKKFSIGQAVKFGWGVLKDNLWFLLGIAIAAYLISLVPFFLALLKQKSVPFLSTIINIVNLVLNSMVAMGLIKVSLRFCNYEKARFSDLLPRPDLFLKFLLSNILFILILFLGILLWVLGAVFWKIAFISSNIIGIIWHSLFFIPTIILMLKFQFFGYFIMDKNLGPIAALRKSAEITEGAKRDLFLFWVVMLGISLIGLIALIVGIFIAAPVIILAHAFVYRSLLAKAESAQI